MSDHRRIERLEWARASCGRVQASEATERDAQCIEVDWRHWAETAQLPPPVDWRVWLFMGGRGAGKTRAGAEWVRGLVESGAARRIALVGPTLGDVREVMIEGPSGLRSVGLEENRPAYEVSRRRLIWPNGAEGFAFSAEDPDSLRGPQFDAAWCDEIGAWPRDNATWDMLMFALRVGRDPRVAATTTPRARPLVKRLARHIGRSVALTRAATRDNAHNLAPGFVDMMEDDYAGARLGLQELDGLLVEDPPGALFTRDVIERGRVRLGEIGRGSWANNKERSPTQPPPFGGGVWPADVEGIFAPATAEALPQMGEGGEGGGPSHRPAFDRLLVAVDPPATSGPRADACGIVAAGRIGPTIYILADASARGLKPLQWAGRAVALARTWGAGEIVAEANQGGEMVRQVLEMAGALPREGLRVTLRHARQPKQERARPVSVMYDQGEVRHAGVFRELEDEMCAFGAEGERSPDRVDALVWAVASLTWNPGPKPSIRPL
jgi:phage terminase large subunit-like protein